MGKATDWHFAHALECVADCIPDRVALIDSHATRTWKDYEDRAARLAGALDRAGIRPGSKIGLLMHNSNVYLESHFAAFKLGASPINVNYRYREQELAYLLDNADVEVLVYHDAYREVIADVAPSLPRLKILVEAPLDGKAGDPPSGVLRYDTVLETNAPLPRRKQSADDLYILYTGGTTGLPKGVMFRNGATCKHLAQGYRMFGMPTPDTLDDVPAALEIGLSKSSLPVSLVVCPLMHGTGIWVGAMNPQLAGGCVLTIPELGLDADRIWRLVEQHRVTFLTIVGDAFGVPMLEALDIAASDGRPYDVSSLRTIISSGVMWSSEVKRGLLRHGDFTLIDAIGSTEAAMGGSVTRRGHEAKTGRFTINANARIISDDGRMIEPGSGETGRLASPSAMIGYYKDPKKTQEIITEIDGVHYVVPGDYAAYEDDGSIRLLGRGSTCINTAGEKVYPEEVEETLKLHPLVIDCLVIGQPDNRYGQRVVALVAVAAPVDTAEILSHARNLIAGYKVPKEVFLTDAVQRAPNGKPDYEWAKSVVAKYSGLAN
ncbi:AMP-binding protein [Henriciella mobilis]|uniref:Acyl-CoA synthetase n=1 Tax=Henriciella mobilis TaxID=2305467 RepID=A0A399RJ63_9PROT|nr:AMP-binding protein [Henriciella mobilis]RIJ29872.1 acyl-CoA synthetase [Henriciella mobilis]